MNKPFPLLTLKSSKLLALWLIIIYGSTVVCIGFLSWRWELKFLLAGICLIGFIVTWRRHVLLRGARAIKKITHLSNGDWALMNAQNQLQPAELLPHSLVTRFFMLLHFRLRQRRQKILLVLPRDALDQNEFRRLQVHILTEQ